MTTIRHKKITVGKWNSGKAGEVASAIATKAFEHLLAPVRKQEHDLALKAYTQIMKDCGLTEKDAARLARYGLVELNEQVAVEVRDTSGNEVKITTEFSGDDAKQKWVVGQWNSPLNIPSNKLYDEAMEIVKRRNELMASREDLTRTLITQVGNRSTKEVMAEWPEAATIVAEIMEVEVPPMIKPLEELLARFLPMLPAPK